MRSITTAFILAVVMTVPLGAQGRGNSRGVPQGQSPPSGTCRVWYNDRAPSNQPAPMSCSEAERIAARDRDARVIYGPGSRYPNESRDRYPNRNDDRYGNDGRYGRNDGYGNRGGYGSGGYGGRGNSAGYQTGYQDGLDKGREDARDRDSYDPVRHSRYRSADRGYDRQYGSKDQYKLIYRDGFEAGYSDGYRNSDRNRRGGNGGVRLPWPF
jgi:hypothetical protein